MRLALCAASILCLSVDGASAQKPEPADRLWISGQANVILQRHGAFPAPYSGDHSLRPVDETATSTVLTLFTGVQLARHTEVIVDVESAGGRGISDAFGLAGFTNLDVVRNPSLGAAPYLARAMFHRTIALGSEEVAAERTPLSLARKIPARRLDIRVGKFGTADFFDVNSAGSDSHLQFMNWTVDNNGAYDYAADTRGYTWGAIVEYQDRAWGIRFGEMLMPTVANGIDLDWHIWRARAENVEIELRTPSAKRQRVVRLLSYVNHANMGDYRAAITRYVDGTDAVPTIENTRAQGRIKYGFGANVEQETSADVRVFGRLGWNEPHFESFAYTEVNGSAEVGADAAGARWKRPLDRLGGAVVTNGLSPDHRQYLALGGRGFLLGDGALRYGREAILEGYYTAHLWRGLFASADVQHITNPGYNRDRGPVSIVSVRVHADF
jgi:high affinity Mn2+ porin